MGGKRPKRRDPVKRCCCGHVQEERGVCLVFSKADKTYHEVSQAGYTCRCHGYALHELEGRPAPVDVGFGHALD